MYTKLQLSTRADLLVFQAGYQMSLVERSSGELQLGLAEEYLGTSRVLGIYDRSARLVGGYVVRCSTSLRCLRAIPDDVRRSSLLLSGVSEHDLCELTCIWRNDGISAASFGVSVWPRIIVDCVRERRRYILGLGFDNRMNDIYQVWSPTQIYYGPSAAPETSTTVCIFAFSRPRLVANFVTNFLLHMPRRMLRAVRRRAQ